MTDPFKKLKDTSRVPIDNYCNIIIPLIRKGGFEQLSISRKNKNTIYFTATYGVNEYHFYILPFVFHMFHDINKNILLEFLETLDNNSENIVLPIHETKATAILGIIQDHKNEINQYRNILTKIDFYYFNEDTDQFTRQNWESWEEYEYDAENGTLIFLDD